MHERWGDIGLQKPQRARRRIFARVAYVIGSAEQAARWLSTEKRALAWKRPIDVIDTAPGRYRVLALLAVLYE